MRADIICLITKDYLEWEEGRQRLERWLRDYRGLSGPGLRDEASRIIAELRQGAVLNRPLKPEDARLVGGIVRDHFVHFTILFLAMFDGHAKPQETAIRIIKGFGEMAGSLCDLEHHQRLRSPLELARLIAQRKALPEEMSA